MTEELKPCPFCLGVAGIVPSEYRKHVVRCQNCGAESATRKTEAEAVEEWNTRAESDEVARLKARIAELEKAREVIATGWVIVDESPPIVCYAVHDTINEAWEEYQGGCGRCQEESLEDMQRRAEGNGYRAVKVAVVRVEE